MALGQARASCERLADAVAALQAAVRREVGEEGGLSGDGTIGRGAGDGGKNVAADNLHGLEQQARLALRESSRRIESVRLLVRTQRQQQPNTSVSLQSLKESVDVLADRRRDLARSLQAASAVVASKVCRGCVRRIKTRTPSN